MNPIVELALRDGVDDGMPHYKEDEDHPFEAGWNAAIDTWRKREAFVMNWFQNLSPESQAGLTILLEQYGILFVSVQREKVLVELNLNDTFGLACADSEVVPEDKLFFLGNIWRGYGGAGLIAWAALTRNAYPLPSIVKGEDFRAAMAFLTKGQAFPVPKPVE